MKSLTQPLTEEGLLIPRSVLDQCGLAGGAQALIRLEARELRVVPAESDPDEIADRAATYAFEHVGDATSVGRPVREGQRWRVPVVLPHQHRTLGYLVLSDAGEIVPDESDSPRALRARADEA